MQTEIRKAALPAELRSLLVFDHKAFSRYPADWFHPDDWLTYDSWWLLLSGRKIGCCAFQLNSDLLKDGSTHAKPGSLYIAPTALLPAFIGLGFGALLKSWQICYARQHGFKRIVANTRKSNRPMLALNKKFGFQIIHSIPRYYAEPAEAAIVMQLLLP